MEVRMKKLGLIIVSVFTLYMVLGASHSWAACIQKDLSGTWYVYFNGINPDAPSWGRGAIRVDVTGNIKPGAKIFTFNLLGNQKTQAVNFIVTGGNFKLNANCIATGNIKVKLGNIPLNFKVIHSAMDRGKTIIHGIWQGSNKTDTGLMTIIRK
jgi:hypothetical protein